MATVSILIPAYKPDYLFKAIVSAQAQTFTDIEILVGDDNVDDKLRAIVESFDDPRIRYFHHACGDARLNSQRLWAQASGKYIKWLYDDDLLMPGSVDALVDALRQNPGAAMAFHERAVIDDKDNVIHVPPALIPAGQIALLDRRFLVQNMIAAANNFIGEPSNVMMVRDAVDISTVMKYKSWDITYLNDVAMYMNLAEHAPLVLVGGHLSCFRRHAAQNSANASPIISAGFYEWEVMVRGEATAGQLAAETLGQAKERLKDTYTYAIQALGLAELDAVVQNLNELTQQPTADLYASPQFRTAVDHVRTKMAARGNVA